MKKVALAVALLIPCVAGAAPLAKKEDKKVPPVLNFTMKGLDGKDVNLSQYQGKVVLIVNVASQCGYLPPGETGRGVRTPNR